MNVLVCVKQVPEDEDLKLDPVTKTLIRTQGTGRISEYDKYALEIALKLKEETGGEVTAITMGPPASENVLKYCLSVGADDVYLLSDRAMGGADAYATVNTLAAAKEYLEKKKGAAFNLILLGKQASDSDTSLVMPELAEALGYPQMTFVVDYKLDSDALYVCRETDKGTEEYKVATPVVMSVGKTPFPARYPTIKLKLAANRKTVPSLSAEALGLDPLNIGVKGSKTTVGASYFPEASKEGVRIEEASGEAAAKKLAEIIRAEI